MDYSAILSRAFQLLRQHRFLWWLGILAMFTEGGVSGPSGGNFNFPYGTLDRDKHEETRLLDPGGARSGLVTQVERLRMRVQTRPDAEEILEKLEDLRGEASAFLPALIAGAVLLLLLALAVTYISLAAKAGLILSVEALESQNQALGFGAAWQAGAVFVWRLWGLLILVGLVMLVLVGVAMLPILVAVPLGILSESPELMIGPILIAVGLILLMIPVFLYLSLLEKLASRWIVLRNGGILAGLSTAHQIVVRKLGPALLTWLITLALGIGYSLALILPLLIVGAALVGVGVAIYAVAKIVGVVIYGVLAGMVLLAALLFLNGVFTAYISSYWTLAFRALEYLAAGVPGRPLPQKQ